MQHASHSISFNFPRGRYKHPLAETTVSSKGCKPLWRPLVKLQQWFINNNNRLFSLRNMWNK